MTMVRRVNVKRPDDGKKIEKNVKENDNPAANIKSCYKGVSMQCVRLRLLNTEQDNILGINHWRPNERQKWKEK